MAERKRTSPVDIKDVLTIVRKRKWLLIVPLVIISAIAYVGTHFLTPMYQSSTIVWIDRPSNVSRELSSIIGTDRRESREELRNQRQALQTEITSQNYLFQLIRDLKLDDDEEISREAAKARETTPEYSLEQIKFNLLVKKLREQISVEFNAADQIKLTIESENSVRARDMANRLTEILEQEKTKYEMEKILDNQTFTDLQLQRSQFGYELEIDSLNAARARLSKLQLPENIASEQNRLDILSTIDKTKLDQQDYQRELASLESKLKEYNLSKVKFKYTDTIIELRTSIDGLVGNYANMMEKYAWNDQNVINTNIRLNDNIKLLEDAVGSAIMAQYATYPANQLELLKRSFIVKENIDILVSKQNRFQQTLTKIDTRLNTIPRLESEIAELTNRVENARRYRDAFRSEETTVNILSEQAKERTKYKVIEPAQLALAPYWPDKNRIVLMGVVMGLVLGCALVLIVELLDDSFKKIEEVEDLLDLPVLATIPKIEDFNISR